MSPFAHKADIRSVESLTDRTYDEFGDVQERFAGGTVVFRAVPGMTAEWLQRLVDCHLARNAALGHDVPEMPYCPLVPKGVSAKVMSVGDGFAVQIRGANESSAQEVLRRAKALLGDSPNTGN